MKRIASLITAVIIMLNVSLAYMTTIKADGYGIKVTSEEGSEIQIIPTSNKIKSWQVESGNTTVTNNKFTMPGEDTTIIAVTLATNTLTIQMPDFTRIENRTEEESITIEAVEIEGKEFTSWTATGITLTEEQITNATITITMPENAVTLVANYQNKTYTITYDANGGSGAPTSQTKTHGEAIAISETTPTKEGYTFKGWATSNTATTAEYEAGSAYTTNTNLSLYAVWQQEVTAIIANEDVLLGAYITYVPSKTTSTVLGTDSGARVNDMMTGRNYETTKGEDGSTEVTDSEGKTLANQIYNPSSTTNWRVLQNNNGQLDIISTESIGSLTLRGATGYTRVVYTLNKLCKDYINLTYADDARNPGYAEGSSCEIIDTEIYPLRDNVSGFPYTDGDCDTDISQIKNAGVLHSNGKVWLAARVFDDISPSMYSGFSVRGFESDGRMSSYSLYSASSDSSNKITNDIRPIVTLKSKIKIIDGEGTEASPYAIYID